MLCRGMAENLTVYEVDIDPNSLSATGVHAISFVEYPAIESNFIALSAFAKGYNENSLSTQRLATVNNAPKYEVTGPALIPDFEILRMDQAGKLYAITFTKDAIIRIRDKFSRELNHRRTDQEHGIPLAGNTVVESWIVTELNKASTDALMGEGSDIPVGSWMITMKIDDREYYHREILSGNVRGFSVYGYFDYFEQAQKDESLAAKAANTTTMSSEKKKTGVAAALLAAISNVFTLASKAAGIEACTKYMLEDGTTEITVNDDTMEPFYLVDGIQGDKLPDGDYILNDGRTLVVTDGKQTEIKDAEATEDESETANEPAAEAQTLAAFALRLGKTAQNILDLAHAHGVAIRLKADKVSRGRTQLHKWAQGESLATLKASAAKLAAFTERESLSILFDTASQKPMYVDQNSGMISYVEDHGGYLYAGEFVPAGTYTLADGTSLAVVEKTEIIGEGTEWEWTYTNSFVDFEASTVPIEVLVPWTKKATSEIAELAKSQAAKLSTAQTELATANTEIAALKAQIATLKGEPAAKPKVVPNGDTQTDFQQQYAALRTGLAIARKNPSK